MKFEYTALLLPSGVKPDNITSTKKFVRETEQEISKGDRVEEIKDMMVEDGFIDRFGLRNYWTFSLGQTRLTKTPWDSTDELIRELESIEGVDYSKNRTEFTINSVVLNVESNEMSNVKNEIKSKYGNDIPIYQGYNCYEIMLSTKWLGSDEFFFDEVKQHW